MNELFLASVEGPGLYNINPLEAIIQKCNVLCASEDNRNPQVSKEELRKADYIFYRTFDVAKRKIEESFPEEIAGVKVKNFFNRKKDEAIVHNLNAKEDLGECGRKSNSSSRQDLNGAVGNAVKGDNTTLRPTTSVHKGGTGHLCESTCLEVARRPDSASFYKLNDEQCDICGGVGNADLILTCSKCCIAREHV